MLNLLPSQQKKKLRLEFLNQAIVSAAIAVVFIILILASLLLVARGFLNTNLDEKEGELAFWQSKTEIKELENLEKRVKKLNENLIFLDGRQKEQVKFSLILEDLAKDMPLGIRFDDLSIKGTEKVSIRGYSLTRDILLTFKTTLESNPRIINFDFPLSNLTKARDIDFYLSFEIANL